MQDAYLETIGCGRRKRAAASRQGKIERGGGEARSRVRATTPAKLWNESWVRSRGLGVCIGGGALHEYTIMESVSRSVTNSVSKMYNSLPQTFGFQKNVNVVKQEATMGVVAFRCA